MFPALISRHLIVFSPNYPLKFCLSEFSPGGYYSGKFHQNLFSIGAFCTLGWGRGRSSTCVLGAVPKRPFLYLARNWEEQAWVEGGEAGCCFPWVAKRPLVTLPLGTFN